MRNGVLAVFVLLVSLAASAAGAQSWDETTQGSGDAGELPGTAQSVTGTGSLTSVTGSLTSVTDRDLFVIRIANAAAFSATTVGSAGTNDTVLYLLDASGSGIAQNDDTSGTEYLSTLPVGNALYNALPAGDYIICVVRYYNHPQSSLGDIWTAAQSATTTINGPANANPVTGWQQPYSFGTNGAYTLTLTGCEFVAPPSGPEINLRTPSNANAPSGSTVNVGSVITGTPTNLTWTVQNLGAANLDVTSITAAASGVGNCSVTPNPTLVPASPVAATSSATFDTLVTATANGAFEFTITVNNNDADEGTYTVIVQGVGVTPQTLPYVEDFEGATPLATWSITGQAGAWHVTTNHPNGGAACLGYCTGETQPSATPDGNYDFGGVTNSGAARSPLISIPATGSFSLSFDHFQNTETGTYDQLTAGISLDGTTFDTVLLGPAGYNNTYTTLSFDVSSYAGQLIYVLFFFDTIDNFANSTAGVRIDNLQLVEAPEMDVLRGATAVADGGTDTGISITGAGANLTYTIENNGGSDLNLTGTPLVSVTAGTNISSVTVTTDPNTPVTGGGSTNFIINVVPTTASVGGDAYDFTVSIDNNDANENPYNFTVSGNAYTNQPPVVTVGAGNWVDAGGGLFTLTLNPGAAINDTLTVTDPTPDNMTVDVVTAAALTGITGQPADITTPTAGPLSLTWTGTADGSNTPGNYDWTIDINDGVSTTNITARIIIVDVAPQHTPATGISGDGSVGTPYLTTYAENDPASLSVNLANVSDANTGQNLNLSTPIQTGGPTGGSGFTFSLVGGVLSVAPSATLVAADVGTQVFSMDVDDGPNTVTIYVSITVLGNSGAISISNASPLPAGTVGAVYTTVTLTATGGTAPYTYTVISGALPAGLSLSLAGDITGTPTLAGTANFTVRATDSLNDSGTKAFTLTVNAPATGSGGGGGGGGGCSTDGEMPYSWLLLLGLLSLTALVVRTRKA